MAGVKASAASQGSGITKAGRWTVILASLLTSMNRAASVVAHRLVDQGLDLNQARLCVIPVPSNTTSRARRRRTR